MKCTAHPNVETNLACGKCGTPICPKCLVHTPVGARCRECANLKRLPVFEISPQQYVKAVGLGLALAVAVGIAWGWFRELIPFFGFFGIIVAGGVGYLIGEAISRSINRKRGTVLQVIGGVCFAISYVVSNLGFSESGFTFYFNPWGILALGVGVFVATSRLR